MRGLTHITVFSLAAFAMALPVPAGAQTAPDPAKLESITKAEEKARAKDQALMKERESVAKEITRLQKDLQKAAQQTRSFEREALSLQNRIEGLTERKARLETQIQVDRGKIMELIAALQRLELSPPPAAASTPDDAIKAAQASQLMRGISESLTARADNLNVILSDLEKTTTEFSEQQTALAANQIQLKKRREAALSTVKRKTTLRNSLDADREISLAEVSRLAEESKNLRDLIENFESETADIGPRLKPNKSAKKRPTSKRRSQPAKPVKLPKGTVKFAKAKGQMTRPITGPLLRNYGRGEKGLTYKGTSNGQVLAPYAGRVEFSGPFKNYEQVVILNVGGGYFILLTGLGQVFVEAGDNMRLGEPVGALPYTSKSNPNLYIELRKDGKPLNPAPWFEPRPVKTG